MQGPNYSKLKLLPLGSVRAEGWLKEQLRRNADGMGGHMPELEPKILWDPYVNKTSCDRWTPGHQAGWGAEIAGNYWFAQIMLAYGLDDPEMIEMSRNWVDTVLKTQQADGYVGAYHPGVDMFDDFNAWGTNTEMKAFLAFYEATGREDVLEAVRKCLLWFCDNWAGNKKTRYVGFTMAESMAWANQYLHEPKFVKFIDEYVEFLQNNDLYDIRQDAMRAEEFIYNSMHTAGYAAILSSYAAAYQADGDEKNLEAATKGYDKVLQFAMHHTGGMANFAEYMCPVHAVAETEYCTFGFMEDAALILGQTTADPKYIDMVERIVFNGAQGARKKDEKGIAYMSSPNQIMATNRSSYFNSQQYAPVYSTACCPVISVRIVPNFLRSLAMEGEDGLYLNAYGPATIRWNGMTLTEDTRYPFRDTITFTVSGSKVAKLHFRIPGWCKAAKLSINGQAVDVDSQPGTFFGVERAWQEGDVITLQLPMEVKLSKLDDSGMCSRYPMAVEYGPLLFSLQVPEKWVKVPGNPYTPLPEGWDWYDVRPVQEWDDRGDEYGQQGLRKHNISWNVAIDETLDPEAVKVEFCDGGYVWENPQVKLHLPGYKALYSYPPYANRTAEPFNAPIDVQQELELELVPHGCTNLRITYIPRAKLPMKPMPVVKNKYEQ